MDMSEYKKEFISEAKDHTDFLNEGLLTLEKTPEDEDNINKLFRSFHTLKGNAAAMGFMKFSELSHSLEDLLSKVRDKKLHVSKELIDVLLEGVDLLEQGLKLIDEDNSEGLEPDNAMANIKKLLGTKDENFDTQINSLINFSEDEQKEIDEEKKKGLNIFRVIISFDAKNILKTAKSLLIIRDLTNQGRIIHATPALDDIKQGKFSDAIELVFSIQKTKEDTDKIINKVSGLKEVKLLDLDEKYEAKTELKKEANQTQTQKNNSDKSNNSNQTQTETVKVEMNQLDFLMNLVGELLISNIRLKDIDSKKEYQNLKSVLTGIDRIIMDLKDEVMEVRMLPIGHIFNRYPRMVRDLAGKQNKKINLVLEGSDIKFDRTVLNEIGDPLIHLLRNSVDHGIETPDERINSGKKEEGTINLIARRDKNNAIIELFDDGAGIDPQRVKESCIKKGIITKEEADKLTDKEAQMLIFKPGSSTNEVITDISGRGVGMDVVLSKISKLGGKITLDSKIGEGTTIKLELPLTVAIVTAFLVRIKDETYAIPLVNIDENLDIKLKDVKTIRGQEVFELRGREIPLLWLHELTGMHDFERSENLTVMVVNKNTEKIGLVVDEILSQQQILIKALQNCVKNTKGFAGVTILGDGNVALILDINSLI